MTNRSILLVEDGVSPGAFLPATLRAMGHDVYFARSINEARNWCEQRRPDIVISEFVLPDGNGLALMDALAAVAPGVQVLFATYDASTDHAVLAMRAGAQDYLVKPVDATTLGIALGNAFAQSSTRENAHQSSGLHPADAPEGSYVKIPIGDTLESAEKAIVHATINASNGSIPKAARILGVSPSTLYRKLDAWARDDGQ